MNYYCMKDYESRYMQIKRTFESPSTDFPSMWS